MKKYSLYVNCDCIAECDTFEEAKMAADEEHKSDNDAVIDVNVFNGKEDVSIYGYN